LRRIFLTIGFLAALEALACEDVSERDGVGWVLGTGGTVNRGGAGGAGDATAAPSSGRDGASEGGRNEGPGGAAGESGAPAAGGSVVASSPTGGKGEDAGGTVGEGGGNVTLGGGTSTVGGQGFEPGPCDLAPNDFDEDGLCDATDRDDDDDGIPDPEDVSIAGADTSLDATQPPGGRGSAPNAVLNEPCVRRALNDSALILDANGLSRHEIVLLRRHDAFDRSGFYRRAENFGYILASTDGASGPVSGSEFHLVRVDDFGEVDHYRSSGVGFENDEELPGWRDVNIVYRGEGNRYTVYTRMNGLVNIATGTTNPLTGSSFEESLLSVLTTEDNGVCRWRFSLIGRVTRVARSELVYLCTDEDRRYALAPQLEPVDAHCEEGRFERTPEEIRQPPCLAERDSDEDGIEDCVDDDDDDDGVRDGDDLILGGVSLALDPTRPGDEPSVAPNAMLNESCIKPALARIGVQPSALVRTHAVPFQFLVRGPQGSYIFEDSSGPVDPPLYYPALQVETTRLYGDRFFQMGVDLSGGQVVARWLHRRLARRGDERNYAAFLRVGEVGVIGWGELAAGRLEGRGLLVRVPPRPQPQCPAGFGGWSLISESYDVVRLSELDRVCNDGERVYLPTQVHYRADGVRCVCTASATFDCDDP